MINSFFYILSYHILFSVKSNLPKIASFSIAKERHFLTSLVEKYIIIEYDVNVMPFL